MNKDYLKKIFDNYQHDKIYINEKSKILKEKKSKIDKIYEELKNSPFDDGVVNEVFEKYKIEKQQILDISNKNNEIEKIINNLKQPYRNVLYFKYIEFLTFDEISLKMNYSTPRIYQLHNKGLDIILENENNFEKIAE